VALVGFHTANVDVADHRILKLWLKVTADGDILAKESTVFFFASEPIGFPASVDSDTESNSIDFLTHAITPFP
jgi:hypothetical protein